MRPTTIVITFSVAMLMATAGLADEADDQAVDPMSDPTTEDFGLDAGTAQTQDGQPGLMSRTWSSFKTDTSLGLGSVNSMRTSGEDTEEYMNFGVELYGTWAYNNYVAARGGVYYQISGFDEAESVIGLRGSALLGYGVKYPGWRIYTQFGLARESWSWSGTQRPDETHSFWFAGLGGGYSWERIEFDLTVNYRDPSSFDDAQGDFYNHSFDGKAFDGGVSLGYRF